MRRAITLAAATAVAAIAGGAATESARSAATLCVGVKAGCFATIEEALADAADGDTIVIGPGAFDGGITITKSVQLVGAGAAATMIQGGGPVITIGELEGTEEPTVSISRVTITGGVNDSTPQPFAASGGGVWIPPGAGNTTGATVSISDSVITGNRVAPKTAVPLCGHPCAFASGAGINSAGTLVATNTKITDNVAGSTASDTSVASYAAGGGIINAPQGTLTLRHSVVAGNRASVTPPNGRNTDGGGIVSYGELTVEASVVAGNTSKVEASVPSSFVSGSFTEANAGGLYLVQSSSTTITRSSIAGNSVHSTNTAGDASAEAAGIDAEGSLLLTDSAVRNNTAAAIVPAASGFLAESDGGGIQVRGSAAVRESRITNNSLISTSESGLALASGGGVANIGGDVTLEHAVVTANSASATGVGGFNLGGGILNVVFGGGLPELTLANSVITANTLSASHGVISQGGGLYTADPFTGAPLPVAITRTVLGGNKPDQCFGC